MAPRFGFISWHWASKTAIWFVIESGFLIASSSSGLRTGIFSTWLSSMGCSDIFEIYKVRWILENAVLLTIHCLKKNKPPRDFTGGPAVKRLPCTGWEIRIPHATAQLSSGATAREFMHCDQRSFM